MMKKLKQLQTLRFTCLALCTLLIASCSSDPEISEEEVDGVYLAVENVFEGTIDLNNLENYADQAVPNYINRDNTNGNPITDAGATLGRALFYDKNLSTNGEISCASCHQQQHAFGDLDVLSTGANGLTGRHSMRLINARFSNESSFFWDERAATLEEQTTMPIQDHAEMGFSGQDGDPSINDLQVKLASLDYYQELFARAFGDEAVTEDRMQMALAQFVRSIQSFDSKYDVGRQQANNDDQDFSNFTDEENLGKLLFLRSPRDGGAGCEGCHRAPAFDIDPDSDNNGVISVANSTAVDLSITRAPSLRDLFNANGQLNGPLMHDGSFTTALEVINHYNNIMFDPQNTNLDNRLSGGRQGQNLGLSEAEKEAIVAFLKTLSGSDVYTNTKYSDPF
jgi:cytochrome c peroxidase